MLASLASRAPVAARAVLLALVVVAALLATACAPALTPADIEQYGTRTYPGTSRAQVFRGSVAALRTLGYDTAVVDEGAGRIKSAPKLLVVHASGTRYSARATGSSLAWDIDVVAAGAGTVVRARPRGYEGGQSVPASRMNGEYIKRTYETLFAEIESNLPAGASRAKVGSAAPR
jgi:hypothetical protein